MNCFLSLILAVSLGFLAFRRGLIFLQIAQQDEYSSGRLAKWYLDNKAFDKKVTGVLVLALLLGWYCLCYALPMLLATIAIGIIAYTTIDPRQQAKLKLNFTVRAKKIFNLYKVITLIILGLVTLCCCALYIKIILAIIFVQILPGILILTLKLLEPAEARLQAKFFEEAAQIVRRANPQIIGITGSYGKTSVKNALADILQVTLGSTFWPSAGVNSRMGITREIRERLTASFRFAVVEMAAYRLGSIAKLCELAPPTVGIITAIGKQHLERFGSQDVTYQAKTELARAVPRDGILVVNADNILANKAGLEHERRVNIFYGLNPQPHVNFLAKNISYSFEGSKFEIEHQGTTYQVKTKLLGRAAVSNLTCVFATALTMGAKSELIIGAFANIQPVNNRLAFEKTKVAGGTVYYLHDGYNSNEEGFQSALEVMQQLPAKRRIIMTPGVIELGAEESEINQFLASKAAEICDYVIVVGPVNKTAFQAGVGSEKLIVASTREIAFQRLAELTIPETIILIENDLSDYHEATYKF